MMKKLTVLLVMFVMLIPSMGQVHAQDSVISFEGEAEKFIYRNNQGEVFGGFKNLLPGEKRTEELTLVNNDYRELRFYMNSEILKAFGNTDSKGIAYDVTFKINGEDLFSGKVGGDQKVGMTDGKTDHSLIATLQKGESAILEMTLQTDGDTMDNSYMNAMGTVKYTFSVEQDDEAAPIVETVVNKVIRTVVNPITKVVQTGDPTVLTFFGVLIGASGLGIIYIIATKRKKEENKNEEK